jgi:N-acetylglucosamine kinase-like BadF-type ATPase
VLLAVDGGGSKLDAVLLRRDGTVLGAARVRQRLFDENGGEGHLADVERAAEAAARDAGIDPTRRPVADLGVYCLAGADLPSDDRRIARGLRRCRLTDRDLVRNDTFAVLRSGTDRSWGVGVVAGYGINACGVAPDGRTHRFPAIGLISGDWGGGRDIGGSATWHALRSEDGRGPKTVLQRTIPAHFGLRRAYQIVEAVHAGTLDDDRVSELPPLVFAAAARGDAVARSIIDQQADEVVVLATVTIRKLRMKDLDVDVVLGGGVFRNQDGAFFDRIEGGVQAVAPAARVKVVTDPPVIGATLIGLDQLGAPRASFARVRRTLTHERLTGHTRRGR